MEGYEIVIALILGLLVLAVISIAIIPRLIEVNDNSTKELNATVAATITAAPLDNSNIYIVPELFVKKFCV